jgi:hypothetical protein
VPEWVLELAWVLVLARVLGRRMMRIKLRLKQLPMLKPITVVDAFRPPNNTVFHVVYPYK